MDDTNHTPEATAIAALAQKPFVETIVGIPHIFSPNGGDGQWDYSAHENLLPTPTRKRGTL